MDLNTFNRKVISFGRKLYRMVEEKIVKVNLRRQMENMPKWKRRSSFARVLRNRLKNKKMKISKSLNERIWSMKTPVIRVKIVKDDKTVKAELVE